MNSLSLKSVLFVSLILFIGACSINDVARQIAGKPTNKDNNERTRCMTNIRELGSAAQLYLGDWDDQFPLSVAIDGGKYTKPGANFELHEREDGKLDDSDYYYWANSLQPYLGIADVFSCPAIVSTPAKNPRSVKEEKPPRFLSCIYNGLFNGYSAYYVESPSSVILFWEGLGKTFNSGLGTSNPNLDCTALSLATPCIFKDNSKIGFELPRETMYIHNHGANFGYADSSVRWRKLGVIVSTGFTDFKVDIFRQYEEDGKVSRDSAATWTSPNLPKGIPYYPLFRPNFDINQIK